MMNCKKGIRGFATVLEERLISFQIDADYMENAVGRVAALSITLSILLLVAGFFSTGGIVRQVIAQADEVEYEGGRILQSPFVNDTETAAELSSLLGSDQHILINGTTISNPNNTLPDSININIQDDCMTIPDSDHLYCP